MQNPIAYRLKAALCLGASFLVTAFSTSAFAIENVDMKLVIATDVSRSVDDEEAQLQREGTVNAFLSPEVVKAIGSGSLGKIAVAYIDFSSPQMNKVVVNWKIIKDKASAAAFAAAVRDAPQTYGQRTSISSALELGTLLIQSSDGDIVANRRVIDVSGDGRNNDGRPMTEVHDETIAKGITVNGLPVMVEEDRNSYDLDKYYSGCVIGGKGAFMLVAKGFKDFGQAIRRKLILEISSLEPAKDAAPMQVFRVAATPRLAQNAAPNPLARPVMPAPGSGMPGGCDTVGGGGFGGFGRF